ncbi:central pair associated wd-repeat protein [Ochromonadaceae sp. CCMP2298]|nr:central pair associated wd-repeat protein [Ochromonadaceae sp. CCMP2298]|mmetsp:Transcript_34911/g.76979  ORF Transcript_34911/g.76979 Transcript_34911/m.76979 type:complete len:566 (+) Transcript_34911:89-1786(+)
MDDNKFAEEQKFFEDDENFAYEEVDFDADQEEEGDDDIVDAFTTIQYSNDQYAAEHPAAHSTTEVRPSVVDDFIRNFLIKAGMKTTLDTFNTEWFELQTKGNLPNELSTIVPDLYMRNEDLDQQAKQLREQVEQAAEVAKRAQATWDKFRRERDYHRMHHKRVVQEKEKLINDIKRLRQHMRSYEPAIEEIKRRHGVAMKEKMLIRLERDRIKTRVKALEEQLSATIRPPEVEESPKTRKATRTVRKQASFPLDDASANPYLALDFEQPHLENYQMRKSFKGHLNSVSCCAFHPKKPIFATGSDDETWRLWTVPDCELVMAGEGHTSWLSSLNFHPHGSHLATSSGDGTVKIWEFAQAKCTHTFIEHTQAVWGCEFHPGGDFVASCSMDHTVRVWDLISGKCRQTLRGHVDSVNAVCWQPHTANVCSASGDKTVSVWDGRSGLCVQTLYGHANSVNHLKINNRGDTVVSADADGVVKVWDIRMVAELGTIDAGKYPINSLAIDRGGKQVLAASDDGTVKVLDLATFTQVGELSGHEGPVQCVAAAPNDSYFVSGSSDSTYRVWSK